MMRFVITGGSGFVGSHLVKRLLKENHQVTVFDLKQKNKAFRLTSIIEKISYQTIDFEDKELLKQKLRNFDCVIHFSSRANTAVGGRKDLDLKQGIITTYNILEAMQVNGIKKIIFSSAPAIYGKPVKIPTPENTGMLFPVSLYGAAKLASEGMISAFCHLFDIKTWIFRFGNVVGPDMTRGVINDVIKKIKHNPNELEILGNGTQKKDFIFVNDCIEGILFAFRNSNEKINIFNLSSGTTMAINEVVKVILQQMDLKKINIAYNGGNIGWAGDVPIVHYNINKIKKLGWSPKYNSKMAINLAVKGMLERDE